MRKNKALALVMAFVMVFASVSGIAPANAAERSKKDIASEMKKDFSSIESKAPFENITDQVDVKALQKANNEKKEIASTEIAYEKYMQEEVRLIVELEDEPLIETFTESTVMSASEEIGFEEFVITKEAVNEAKSLEKKQDKVINKVLAFDKEAELLNQYKAVINGFAVKTTRKNVEYIKSIPGVKNVYLGKVYDHVLPEMEYSKGMIGTEGAWDLDYTGKNTIVGIVDTGLDTIHEAFQVAPEVQKASMRSIQMIMNSKTLNSGITNASETYVNEKVPYAYDYEDRDANVNPTEISVSQYGNDHGTHVAGTVAGNNGKDFLGVAYDAQLMIFKVFGDWGTGAYTNVIIEALEDAAILGVDVINMSLGSAAGFTNDDDGTDAVFRRLTDAGVTLAVSAGNNYRMDYNNLTGFQDARYPDSAVVGSDSTFAPATSVASVNNMYYKSTVVTINGVDYAASETAEGSEPKFESLVGPIEVVVVPNFGSIEDYDNLDVEGKIALVSRGNSTFTEKVEAAAYSGAIGIIVRNNQSGTINMAIDDYLIPAVAISQNAGLELLDADTIIYEGSSIGTVADEATGGRMSDFSSLGCTPDLKLKPEITAPGGNITSSVPFNNSYASFSGTSMAAPHVAGVFATVKQYLNENALFNLFDNADKTAIANQLIMSTAEPLLDEYDCLYSPRKQGAGLVNLYRAVTTNALLRTTADVNEMCRPKLELGDSINGTYSSSFEIVNFGEEDITYSLSALGQTDYPAKVGDEFDNIAIAEASLAFGADLDDEIIAHYYVNGREVTDVTVAADSTVTVDVTFEIGSYTKYIMDMYFENGEFVEGFVFLDTDTDVDLSIPFMGFYGDWTKAPIFDTGDANNNQYANQYVGGFCTVSVDEYGDNDYYYLGVNKYDYSYTILNLFDPYSESIYYDLLKEDSTNKLAISPNGDGYFDSFDYVEYGLLRNAKEFSVKVMSADESETYFEESYDYARKSYYYAPYGLCVPFFNDDFYGWAGTDCEGNTLPNNTEVKLVLEATLDYEGAEPQRIERKLTIDTEEPELYGLSVIGNEADKMIYVAAQDNQYIANVEIFDRNYNDLGSIVFNSEEPGEFCEEIAEITTDYTAADLIFAIFDYANNISVWQLTDMYSSIYDFEWIGSTDTTATFTYDEAKEYDAYSLVVTDLADNVISRVSTTENTVTITDLPADEVLFIEIEGYIEDEGYLFLEGYAWDIFITLCPFEQLSVSNIGSRSFTVNFEALDVDYYGVEDYFVTVVEDAEDAIPMYFTTNYALADENGMLSVDVTDLTPGTTYNIFVEGDVDGCGSTTATTKNEFTVNFYGYSGELVSSQTVLEGDEAVAPSLIYPNYVFLGWDADFSSVTSDLDVYPVYELLVNTYTLTTQIDDQDPVVQDVEAISLITLSAPEIEGKEFVAWMKDGKILSTSPLYKFYILENTFVYASYKAVDEVVSDDIANPAPAVSLGEVTTGMSGNYPVLYFSGTAFIPSTGKYTVTEVGTLRAKAGAYLANDESFDMDDYYTGAAKLTQHTYNKVGQFILAIKTTAGSEWSVVAYIKYVDNEGNEYIVYSDEIRTAVAELQ